ncbi:hypothetical protein P7K49_014741, partial [Saguinus oedipus]
MDQTEDDVGSIWKVGQPVFKETPWRPTNSALNTDDVRLEADRKGKKGLDLQKVKFNFSLKWTVVQNKGPEKCTACKNTELSTGKLLGNWAKDSKKRWPCYSGSKNVLAPMDTFVPLAYQMCQPRDLQR